MSVRDCIELARDGASWCWTHDQPYAECDGEDRGPVEYEAVRQDGAILQRVVVLPGQVLEDNFSAEIAGDYLWRERASGRVVVERRGTAWIFYGGASRPPTFLWTD